MIDSCGTVHRLKLIKYEIFKILTIIITNICVFLPVMWSLFNHLSIALDGTQQNRSSVFGIYIFLIQCAVLRGIKSMEFPTVSKADKATKIMICSADVLNLNIEIYFSIIIFVCSKHAIVCG